MRVLSGVLRSALKGVRSPADWPRLASPSARTPRVTPSTSTDNSVWPIARRPPALTPPGQAFPELIGPHLRRGRTAFGARRFAELRSSEALAHFAWVTSPCEAVRGAEYAIVEIGLDVPFPWLRSCTWKPVVTVQSSAKAHTRFLPDTPCNGLRSCDAVEAYGAGQNTTLELDPARAKRARVSGASGPWAPSWAWHSPPFRSSPPPARVSQAPGGRTIANESQTAPV
jgi:hypothetical protein